mmetsp:Transcript_24263/g.55843  ORF Transcript_24263/g.55843 Transcript_24263/m.55843 type:complete len:276 (-) Transcript_24263:697-1524(-)
MVERGAAALKSSVQGRLTFTTRGESPACPRFTLLRLAMPSVIASVGRARTRCSPSSPLDEPFPPVVVAHSRITRPSTTRCCSGVREGRGILFTKVLPPLLPLLLPPPPLLPLPPLPPLLLPLPPETLTPAVPEPLGSLLLAKGPPPDAPLALLPPSPDAPLALLTSSGKPLAATRTCALLPASRLAGRGRLSPPFGRKSGLSGWREISSRKGGTRKSEPVCNPRASSKPDDAALTNSRLPIDARWSVPSFPMRPAFDKTWPARTTALFTLSLSWE